MALMAACGKSTECTVEGSVDGSTPDGKYVYLIDDPPVLYKKGLGSCESEGWIVSYDWDSKQEVSRVQVNHDLYSPGVNVYWRGVHKPKGSETSTPEPTNGI